MNGTHPDHVILGELDEAFRDVYPGVGRVPMLHDPAEDGYVAELDADGRFAIDLPSGKTEAGELPLPRCELRTDLPDPAAVLAAGAGAAAVEVARVVAEWAALVEEAGRRLAPVFEAVCAQLAEATRQREAAGLLPDPPLDARERALAAKRAPGRTGPPAPRMDGRRACGPNLPHDHDWATWWHVAAWNVRFRKVAPPVPLDGALNRPTPPRRATHPAPPATRSGPGTGAARRRSA